MADDRNRIEPVVRQGAWAGLYPVDRPSGGWCIVEDSDNVFFSRIQNSAHHVLHELLPHPNTHDYELKPRHHNLSLTSHWDQRNFISRSLLKDIY